MSQLNKAASLINLVMRLLPTFLHKTISIFCQNYPDKMDIICKKNSFEDNLFIVTNLFTLC